MTPFHLLAEWYIVLAVAKATRRYREIVVVRYKVVQSLIPARIARMELLRLPLHTC
ncbi:MAG: hypothetical protein DHS20C12_30330 [Pseudohongiella sp.]|nr:MAG: hypothetical protein DHS20C12_30330 [Pseudohongiella sp.]